MPGQVIGLEIEKAEAANSLVLHDLLIHPDPCFLKLQTDQEEPDEDKQLLKVAEPQEAKELKDRIVRMLWVGDGSVWR